MSNSLNYILFALLLFFTIGAFAQQQDFIGGRLLDAKTNEPVVFANIRIKDRALGIITNVDGSFRIPLIYKEYGDIIEISSMGYQAKEISITEFAQGELNIIKLDPGAIDLQEVIVKAKDKRKKLSAKQIVQKAIDAIPQNYPSTSFSTIGYYRDYQFNEGEYINLNEGILEVFDQGFDQLDDATSETRLFNFDLNEDFKQDSLALMAYDYESKRKIINKAYLDAYGGNEFRILRIHDAIRNYNAGAYDYIGTLKTDFIKNHSFLRGSDTRGNNEELYGIKFWELNGDYRAHGQIYISKVDFAIHKLEYTMYNNRKTNKDSKKNKHGHKQKVIYDVSTDYRKFNGKMYLNYISFHNNFVLNIPPVFKVNTIGVDGNCLCFEVEYNDLPEAKSSVHIPNYIVEFKKNRVRIKTVERLKNKVLLYPMMIEEKVVEMLQEIYLEEKQGADLDGLFDVKVTNVRDTVGNLVNKWTQMDYLQYREFFVQRVKLDSRAPFDDLFMDKRKPIFENQPMVKPKDYNEYWMNTPLQESINSYKR